MAIGSVRAERTRNGEYVAMTWPRYSLSDEIIVCLSRLCVVGLIIMTVLSFWTDLKRLCK